MRRTRAVSSRGERMRASGLLYCGVMGLVVLPASRAPCRGRHALPQTQTGDAGNNTTGVVALGLVVTSLLNGCRFFSCGRRCAKRTAREAISPTGATCPLTLTVAPTFSATRAIAALTLSTSRGAHNYKSAELRSQINAAARSGYHPQATAAWHCKPLMRQRLVTHAREASPALRCGAPPQSTAAPTGVPAPGFLTG